MFRASTTSAGTSSGIVSARNLVAIFKGGEVGATQINAKIESISGAGNESHEGGTEVGTSEEPRTGTQSEV